LTEPGSGPPRTLSAAPDWGTFQPAQVAQYSGGVNTSSRSPLRLKEDAADSTGTPQDWISLTR